MSEPLSKCNILSLRLLVFEGGAFRPLLGHSTWPELDELVALGLATKDPLTRSWVITDAGRAALADAPEPPNG